MQIHSHFLDRLSLVVAVVYRYQIISILVIKKLQKKKRKMDIQQIQKKTEK